MTSTDPQQAETAKEAAVGSRDSGDPEALRDDAWMEACRAELHSNGDNDKSPASKFLNAGVGQAALEPGRRQLDDSQNEADRAEFSVTDAAIEKTGDDAMSKFGHAIGALAERDDDLDDHALDYAAEMASPSPASSVRDEAVAPHIAAAERELERSKAGPVDIFDRIAQAAESQFDESRGSTTKRVSELVDDRRVGTKRWTPSKTMKERMAKLEAARAAATGDEAVATSESSVDAQAASAPSSSQATTVTPGATAKSAPATEEKVEAPAMAEDQTVTISRRSRQPEVEETIETESAGAAEAEAEAEEEDPDGLRVIPGARGRRRDRARKSRLDEDFEKIFDDEGKPSINSLRRKLRSGAADEDSADGETTGSGGTEQLAQTADEIGGEPKKGLFSRLLKRNKVEKVEPADVDEDDLVAAFEADGATDSSPITDNAELEMAEDDDWQDAVETKRKQTQIALPIIGLGIAILLTGLGWFAYKFLFGA